MANVTIKHGHQVFVPTYNRMSRGTAVLDVDSGTTRLDPKPVDVKCEYCSQVYARTRDRCPNCGAPRTR